MSFSAHIRSFLPGIPTPEQKMVSEQLAQYLLQPVSRQCFILKGYAGTGKTTLVSALVKSLPRLGRTSVLLAPTGRAAKVMGSYSGKKSQTIHKKIYRQSKAVGFDVQFGLGENPHENAIFIIDEASMISNERLLFRQSLLEDLVRYVEKGKNCQLIFVGDVAQLPPIGYEESPALDPQAWARIFGWNAIVGELTTVVRQAQLSGILHHATAIRNAIQMHQPGGSVAFPKLLTRGHNDVFRMTGARLVEGLDYAYNRFGMENTLIICRSNKHANLYNQHIRHALLYRDDELSGGDYVMVVKNNYFWLQDNGYTDNGFIANGDLATVRRVRNVHEMYGFRFAEVSLEFHDRNDLEPLQCKVLLDTLHSDGPSLEVDQHKILYERILEDYADIKDASERREKLKSDPYYNAIQLKFAMAVTCHKAQGGQWKAVFVDQGYLAEDQLDLSFLRWLYTACTRATDQLFWLNFSDAFFKEGENPL
jgi:exodeoxyribonuclease-5